MLTDLYSAIIGGLVGFLGAFIGWFFRRRSETAEAVSKETDNHIKLANYYKSMLDDFRDRYEEKFKEVSSLYDLKINMLNNEITILNKFIVDLKKENAALRKRIKELER